MKQWGESGTGPSDFRLPHGIRIDEKGTVYVADRENGRIEKFDLDGNFLGEIPHLGRIYSLKLVGEVLWAGMGPFNMPPGSPGWVVKLDRKTGKILGHLDVPEARGGHSVERARSVAAAFDGLPCDRSGSRFTLCRVGLPWLVTMRP